MVMLTMPPRFAEDRCPPGGLPCQCQKDDGYHALVRRLAGPVSEGLCPMCAVTLEGTAASDEMQIGGFCACCCTIWTIENTFHNPDELSVARTGIGSSACAHKLEERYAVKVS